MSLSSSFAAIRGASKHARSLSAARRFHSPFVQRANSPLTSPQSVASSAMNEKQDHHSPDPTLSAGGTRTYVVSQPDPADAPYEVPSGAYPTSAPYENFTPTEAPGAAQRASTSPSFAHPALTKRVPQNESGVMESAAVRHGEAPGEMHQRGGSFGGAGLVDKQGTKPGEGELADRNPPPLHETAEKFSKLGVDNAWRERK
ncbi:hypothetical protein CERSUDRAFT_89209 [Gelatoporia subvermispora B]|uniref:Uncharacterized protein n=1 Tax=Ceriporiopsis subvermispora (strain B) TaxID=914234 RepID=M2P7M9_CERS8|nr:hypothetical protein CERSUDRAFT_89209 [Gelatoporia subvermispora B]